MGDLKQSTKQLIDKLYENCPDSFLVGCTVRAIRQEKAASFIEALETDECPSTEYVAEELSFEMGSLLQDALYDGTLDASNLVKENKETLDIIAKHLVIKFINLKNDSAKEV